MSVVRALDAAGTCAVGSWWMLLPVNLTILTVAAFGLAHLALAALRPCARRDHAACAVACFLTAVACAGAAIGGAA